MQPSLNKRSCTSLIFYIDESCTRLSRTSFGHVACSFHSRQILIERAEAATQAGVSRGFVSSSWQTTPCCRRRATVSLWPLLNLWPLRAPRSRRRGRSHRARAPAHSGVAASPRPCLHPRSHQGRRDRRSRTPTRAKVVGLLNRTCAPWATPSPLTPPRHSCATLMRWCLMVTAPGEQGSSCYAREPTKLAPPE